MAGKQVAEGQEICPVSEETLFKVSKEIVVKFIETGRVTPATFDAAFKQVYQTVKEAVRGS